MDDIISGVVGSFMTAHPKISAFVFGLLALPVIHLYMQTATIRKVFGMRNGDWLWPQKPRYGGKGPRRSSKSKPPLDDDKTPT
jgi:hypothetical protein